MTYHIFWKDPTLGNQGVVTFPQTREQADAYAAQLETNGYDAVVVEAVAP